MSGQFNPNQLTFFVTPEHECPYLTEQKSKTIFLSPEIHADGLLYTALINQGFRRSGDHVYRPNCDTCKACISVRIPVDSFQHSRSQKRVFSKGSMIKVSTTPAKFTPEHYKMFEAYINCRHKDGDMYPASEKQYKEFLLCDWLETEYLNFYDIRNSQLIATLVYDRVQDGYSAVYTFFDPNYSQFSLGKLAILKLIEKAKSNRVPYVYLGYWIKESQKMSYKGQYRPLECFVENRWVKIT